MTSHSASTLIGVLARWLPPTCPSPCGRRPPSNPSSDGVGAVSLSNSAVTGSSLIATNGQVGLPGGYALSKPPILGQPALPVPALHRLVEGAALPVHVSSAQCWAVLALTPPPVAGTLTPACEPTSTTIALDPLLGTCLPPISPSIPLTFARCAVRLWRAATMAPTPGAGPKREPLLPLKPRPLPMSVSTLLGRTWLKSFRLGCPCSVTCPSLHTVCGLSAWPGPWPQPPPPTLCLLGVTCSCCPRPSSALRAGAAPNVAMKPPAKPYAGAGAGLREELWEPYIAAPRRHPADDQDAEQAARQARSVALAVLRIFLQGRLRSPGHSAWNPRQSP